MVLGAAGYRYRRQLLARVASTAGFGLFAMGLLVGATRYALTSRSYRVVAVPIAIVGIVFCVHAVRLVYHEWTRTGQLVTVVAVFLLLVLPFELYPQLHVLAQERYASQTVTALGLLGVQAAAELTPAGHRIVVRLENGSFVTVVRECNGIYAGALFSAVVAGSRTTALRKAGGIAFALGAVFLVNQLRMAFVATAMARDWFGPILTDENTLEATYYVAELWIGQPLVVVATVAGFLLVDRWIPDVLDFFRDLVSSIDISSGR
jgi:archaeosortase A (PGF-CTERM-specific)